jgi:hypothetical protein
LWQNDPVIEDIHHDKSGKQAERTDFRSGTWFKIVSSKMPKLLRRSHLYAQPNS